MPKWLMYLILAGYLSLGTCASIFLKRQNQYNVLDKDFIHPVFQVDFERVLGWLITYLNRLLQCLLEKYFA